MLTQRSLARLLSSQFLSAEFTCYRSAPLRSTVDVAELILRSTLGNAELTLRRTVGNVELILQKARFLLHRAHNSKSQDFKPRSAGKQQDHAVSEDEDPSPDFQTGHAASFYAFSPPSAHSCQVCKYLKRSDVLCCTPYLLTNRGYHTIGKRT